MSLLTACGTAQPEGIRFAGVPLEALSPSDQTRVALKIEEACGRPPHCPAGAILEQWALDYVKLRARVAAANQDVK